MKARINKLQRRSHHRILALVVVVAAAAGTIVLPATATAGVVGSYRAASVQCDRMSNRVAITPKIAIGSDYGRQRVAYQLAIYSMSTGQWLPSPNYQQWHVIDHNAWSWTQVHSMYGTTGQWTHNPEVATPTHTHLLNAGTYTVWTRYIWEAPLNSGVWYDANGQRYAGSSPWTPTQSYTNYGDYYAGSYCKVNV